MPTNPIHVLLVEDNPGDARFVRELVRDEPDLSIHHLDRLSSGLAHLATEQVDVVLLDLGLPDSQGLDSLRAILASGSNAPVVVLTGHDDEALGRAAVREGAQDYLVKGQVAEQALTRAVRYAIERKIAQARFLEQHATLSAVLESAGTPVFSLDREYRYTSFNRAHAAEVKGLYGADIKLGGSLADYQTVPEDWHATRKTLERALQGETVLESAFSGDDGRSRRYFEVAHHPVRTEAGAIIGVAVFTHDLTARKRADRDLEESKQLIESVVENVPLMIFLKDARDLRFVVLNRAGEDLLGYDRKDLLGKNDLDIFPPEQAAFFVAKDREVLAGGVPVDIPEEPILTAKQGERLLHTRKVCIKGADGGTKYLLGISEDITERKRAEANHQLLEEQLRVSQKMEAIGSLAGGVAHDFNNLLTVILSYTGFAMEGVREGDPTKGDLLEVKKAGEQAAALTRQLLAFSRKQILQPVLVDLNQIAAGTERMLRRILGEDIDLVQVLAPDLGLVKADPGQIEQVLMNLVVNARDAMPEGGKLTIETSNAEIDEEYAARHVAVTPGPYVQVAVTDTGSGMDAQTRARLFEPFFTTKEKGKGTGLGLSTVYGIVKQSGGNIWVYSEPGRGTTFKIYLPRDASVTAPAVKPTAVHRPATGTETILLVEDEEALRKVARRALVEAGYTVLAAANGDEAIRACVEHVGDIQLLLTDVVMPGMSGKTLAQSLSKTQPALKILYMSGYTDNAIVRHGVLDAGTHFLGKPFTAGELLRKVRDVMDGTH